MTRRRARESLSLAEARRIAVAAQGLAAPRPTGRIDRRHFRAVLERLGVIQIDSVNVITRAHELAFFARLGPYPRDALAAWLHDSGEVFEYWAHEASFLPSADHPLMRWRMTAADREAWGRMIRALREQGDYLAAARDLVRTEGPLVPADLPQTRTAKKGPWWDWDLPKVSLEALFFTGEITAVRDGRFQRRYDEPARVLPAEVLATPTPTEDEARRGLVRRAARAHGVATMRDLADYHRQRQKDIRPIVEAMVADGELQAVSVEGWKQRAYLHPEAALPRMVRAAALVAPFDSLVWERVRTELLFGFRYRIEIYTPAAKRVHGYYVLPFLLGDRLVARVDLKTDRQAGVMRVRAAHAEPGVDHDEVAEPLLAEITAMGTWLGASDVDVEDRGDLAPALRATMSR